MASETKSSESRASTAPGPSPLTYTIFIVASVFSIAMVAANETKWLVVPGALAVITFVRLLPRSNSAYKIPLTLLLLTTLAGYFATDSMGTEGRLIAAVVGITSGAISTMILLIIGTWISTRWILALHEYDGITAGQAWTYVFSLLTGIHQPYQVVEDGQAVTTNGKGVLNVLGGPGIVVIRPENAVIFEWGGKVTKIAPAGIVPTRRFEKIAKVLDLRPKWDSRCAMNVLTRDRVPVSIPFGVGFQLGREQPSDKSANRPSPNDQVQQQMPSPHTPPTDESHNTDGTRDTSLEAQMSNVYEVREEDLFHAAYRLSGPWYKLPGAVAELMLRRAVATYDSTELLDWGVGETASSHQDGALDHRLNADPVKIIEENIEQRLRKAAPNWGIRLTGFAIKGIEFPEEIQRQLMQRRWRDKATVDEARARATAIEEVSAAKIEAWQKMLDRILETIKQAGGGEDSQVAATYIAHLQRIELLEQQARQGGDESSERSDFWRLQD